MSASETQAARPLRVVVIGAGIAGLCLAQGLKRAGIPFAVYERDSAPDARLQGYRLNIEPVGAKALQECLPPTLWSRFVAEADDAGAGMGVYDEGLRLLMREDERRPASPADDTHAVSRVLLRELLRSGLEAELNFGKEFVRYETSGTEVTACFADGSKAGGDVLVGADGVTSRLRRQFLPQARDVDTQGVGIGGKLPLSRATEAWLPPCLLRGKSMILPKRDFLFTAVYRRRDRGSPHRPWLAEHAEIEPSGEPDYLLWAYVAHRDTLARDGGPRDRAALRAALVRRMAT
jgi:2-polyprenyl-6-methoxyphenol hydroxylase-like FAD-dependent oxidoreductase